jgi:transposase-like protein
MARKSKYDSEETPQFAEEYARQGLSDEQIAHNLGISEPTYYNWQKKYIEFFEAIKKGKAPVDFEVENSLLKRANGYTYTEEHTEFDANGQIKSRKTVEKEMPPSETAMIFWLKNRKPEQWSDKYKHEISKDIPLFPDVSEDDSDK